MDRLRANCPWNKAQTIDTLRPMTIEEVYELSDAVMARSDEDLKKELGDVLLHIVFYSKIAEEEGKYDIADVAEKLCQKMIFRHPHIFAPDGSPAKAEGLTPEEVSRNWEMIKTKEKGGNKRVLSGIPESLPPVLKALSMQEKARGCGFDWEEKEQVLDKVHEELDEVCRAARQGGRDHIEEEFGDLMFSVINACRLYGIDPEVALGRTCSKFRRRFGYLESKTLKAGRKLTDMTLAEMDAIWDEAKARGL